MFKWFWTILSLYAPEHWIYQIRTDIRLRIPNSVVLPIGFLIQAYRTWAIKPDMKKTPFALTVWTSNSLVKSRNTMCQNTLMYNNEEQFIMSNGFSWLLTVKKLAKLQEIRIVGSYFFIIWLESPRVDFSVHPSFHLGLSLRPPFYSHIQHLWLESLFSSPPKKSMNQFLPFFC